MILGNCLFLRKDESRGDEACVDPDTFNIVCWFANGALTTIAASFAGDGSTEARRGADRTGVRAAQNADNKLYDGPRWCQQARELLAPKDAP